MGLEEVVTLLGPKTQDEVAALMTRASVFVLPSVIASDGQMEGIPVAWMEAMAAGKPVVASGLSGITELVQTVRSGFVVQPGDAASLMQRYVVNRGPGAGDTNGSHGEGNGSNVSSGWKRASRIFWTIRRPHRGGP